MGRRGAATEWPPFRRLEGVGIETWVRLARKHGMRWPLLAVAKEAIDSEEAWNMFWRTAWKAKTGRAEGEPNSRNVRERVKDYIHTVYTQSRVSYRARDYRYLTSNEEARGGVRRNRQHERRLWCMICGKWKRAGQGADGFKGITVEHIPPKRMGGNKRALICGKCNTQTSLLDELTINSEKGTITQSREVELELRPFDEGGIDDWEIRNRIWLRWEIGDAESNRWKRVKVQLAIAEEIGADDSGLLAVEKGAVQRLKLGEIPDSTSWLIVRFPVPHFTASIVKGAFLLLCKALGEMGRDYAEWAQATRDLFTLKDGRRQQFEGERATGGGWIERWIPVGDCPAALHRKEEVGFEPDSKQWVVRVGRHIVVLVARDPYRTNRGALHARARAHRHRAEVGQSQLQTVIDDVERNQSRILWLSNERAPDKWGSKDSVYIITTRERRALKDSIGDVFRVVENGHWRHYRVVHQNECRMLGLGITKEEFNDEVWKQSSRRHSPGGEEPDWRGYPQTDLEWELGQQEGPMERRSYYRYHMIRK